MRRTGRARLLCATAGGLALALSTGSTLAWAGAPTSGSIRSSGVDVSPSKSKTAPPQCGQGQFQITAKTNHPVYPPGHPVVMTSSIKNVSHTSCTIFLGAVLGYSPTFTVTNSAGKVVWNRCWVNDQPGACATVLFSHTLHPGQKYQQKATWDQRSGADGKPPVQVPQGQYTFSTYYQYIGGPATVTFDILVG